MYTALQLQHVRFRPAWAEMKGRVADERGSSCAGSAPRGSTAFGTEPVAVAADRQHVAVVEQTVEDRHGDDRICEHGAPLGDRAVRHDQHGASLAVSTHQLEEQVRGISAVDLLQTKERTCCRLLTREA